MPARCSAGEAFHFHLEPAGHLEVYLGRPCQYLEPDHLARGEPSLWSSHRYGPRVLDAYRSVLAELRRRGRIHPRLPDPKGRSRRWHSDPVA